MTDAEIKALMGDFDPKWEFCSVEGRLFHKDGKDDWYEYPALSEVVAAPLHAKTSSETPH